MRHSLSTSSARDSERYRISTTKNYRGRRPHRLVYHRQYPRTYARRTVYRPERRRIYGKRVRRSPSRPRSNRENPETVDRRRRRIHPLEEENKEASNQDNPEKKLSKKQLNKILDELVADIEERIRLCKKDQLSKILPRNIGAERETRGTSPAQSEKRIKRAAASRMNKTATPINANMGFYYKKSTEKSIGTTVRRYNEQKELTFNFGSRPIQKSPGDGGGSGATSCGENRREPSSSAPEAPHGH